MVQSIPELIASQACFVEDRVDPTYFYQESILTEALHDTPTFEVP